MIYSYKVYLNSELRRGRSGLLLWISKVHLLTYHNRVPKNLQNGKNNRNFNRIFYSLHCNPASTCIIENVTISLEFEQQNTQNTIVPKKKYNYPITRSGFVDLFFTSNCWESATVLGVNKFMTLSEDENLLGFLEIEN